MLLTGYEKEVFRAQCNPSFESLHCIAHLKEDVSRALPYLNAVLGGFSYVKEPPSVTFKVHGRLITVHGDRIALNALKDEAEAHKILEWLKREINDAWDHRDSIQPCLENAPRPKLLDVLKLLPKTNCRECGRPTCMVFATLVVDGIKNGNDCPSLKPAEKEKLAQYLTGFQFDECF